MGQKQTTRRQGSLRVLEAGDGAGSTRSDEASGILRSSRSRGMTGAGARRIVLALDHPEALTRLVILDIVPTYLLYQQITQEFATIFYHWFLLVQPPPFPETMVQNSALYFLRCTLLWLGEASSPTGCPTGSVLPVFQEYLRTFRQTDTIHAICEDYRAAASIHLAARQGGPRQKDPSVRCSCCGRKKGRSIACR